MGKFSCFFTPSRLEEMRSNRHAQPLLVEAGRWVIVDPQYRPFPEGLSYDNRNNTAILVSLGNKAGVALYLDDPQSRKMSNTGKLDDRAIALQGRNFDEST